MVALAALGGCSTLRLAYDNADTVLAWQANSWFDFQGELAEERDRRIAAFLAWHRAQALPRYASHAEEAARRLERGLVRADLEWAYDTVFAEIRQALRAAAQHAAPLLDRLGAENLSHFETRLAEQNRRFAREHLRPPPAERRRQRLKRMIERLEDWLGDLSEEQLQRVRRYNERAPLVEEMRAREHQRLQRELVAMLRAREATRKLADWAPNWDRDRELPYVAAIRHIRMETMDMLLDLDRTLTGEQRRAAVARLRSWAADFEHLMRR